MKKGATHVDWAISMGIFLIYILLTFIFLKPTSQPTYSGNTLLDTVYTGLKDDTTYTVQRGYLIITPTASISPNIDYKIRINCVSAYLNEEWKTSEKQWEDNPQLFSTHLTMFNESLGKVPSNDLRDAVNFDLKNDYCTTHQCPGCSPSSFSDVSDVLEITTKLKNNEPNIFWFIYSEGETYSHLTKSITFSDVICQQQNDCLLNDGDEPLSKVDNFTYEFGVIETYTGFSDRKLRDLKTNPDYKDITDDITRNGYKNLKNAWGFPEDKNFKIKIEGV